MIKKIIEANNNEADTITLRRNCKQMYNMQNKIIKKANFSYQKKYN